MSGSLCRPVASMWRPVASLSRPSPNPITISMRARDLQTTSQRTCRLPATRFRVLAGWMADDLRELRGVRLVAEGLAGW